MKDETSPTRGQRSNVLLNPNPPELNPDNMGILVYYSRPLTVARFPQGRIRVKDVEHPTTSFHCDKFERFVKVLVCKKIGNAIFFNIKTNLL